MGWTAGAVLLVACETPETPDLSPVRIALHAEPSGLDPHLQSEVVARSILGNVFQPLVEFDGDMGLRPALAERWENPDDHVWRFFLRSGVRFHDGTELDVEDVLSSLERVRRHPESRNAGFLLAVEDVTSPAERQVEIRTREPYPILLNKLAFLAIVPSESPDRIEHPIGTGPYRFVGHDDGGAIRLEAWEGSWNAPPALPVAVYEARSDFDARTDGVASGELDLTMDPAPSRLGELEAAEGVEILTRTGLVVAYLQMNLGVPPFDDARVREAVDLALDRRAIVRDWWAGHGVPVVQMVSPNVFGYDPELAVPEPDRDRARALLAEAGHPNGLDLRLEVREGLDTSVIVEQLASVGVRAETVSRPWSEMYARLVDGEAGFYLGGWTCTSGDASDLLDQKVHSPDVEHGWGESNSAGIRDPELDAVIEASGTALRMAERRGLLQEALRRVAEQRALVGLFAYDDVYAVRSDLRWRPRQDGRIYAWEMSR